MTAVQNGQYDATLQDLPAARFYAERFPGLEQVGPPESHGYYVIYVRKQDRALRDALDQRHRPADRLGRAAPALRELRHLDRGRRTSCPTFTGPIEPAPGSGTSGGWTLLRRYRSRLHRRGIRDHRPRRSPRCPWPWRSGLLIAIGRLYGPRPLAAAPLRLRRADPGHAADAPALRALLPR